MSRNRNIVEITRLPEENREKNKEKRINTFLGISNDITVNKSNSDNVVRKNMQDGSYKYYEESLGRDKNEFGGSGLLPKNNDFGGIIALLQNITDEVKGKI